VESYVGVELGFFGTPESKISVYNDSTEPISLKISILNLCILPTFHNDSIVC